ncbi:TrgA family protein [Falsigemmobacter faecalis]|uniref:Tellurium resistance protein n=1 Tax=Falsigemmobacter faecalis TaxID=2488730 RepID=A0A3P3DUF2_9RHOB|nr:TrgA family protein [Falsigemmobacter faecalis]RRH77376.1 tellurium resistance protein [Falsigemmobacter faecalis]
MPTAARLFAALAFMAVGFFAAETYRLGLPPRPAWGSYSLVAALLGSLLGWSVMGRLTGRGMPQAMAGGLRTSFLLAVSGLFLFSVMEMGKRSLLKRYDGVLDALLGVVDLFFHHAAGIFQPQPILVLILGGVLGGALAEWSGRRWS